MSGLELTLMGLLLGMVIAYARLGWRYLRRPPGEDFPPDA